MIENILWLIIIDCLLCIVLLLVTKIRWQYVPWALHYILLSPVILVKRIIYWTAFLINIIVKDIKYVWRKYHSKL